VPSGNNGALRRSERCTRRCRGKEEAVSGWETIKREEQHEERGGGSCVSGVDICLD